MSLTDFINKSENWLRLALFVLGPLTEALLQVLHLNNLIPRQPILLYNFLSQHRNKLNKLKQGKIINNKQWSLMFPSRKKETDSSSFDVSLIIVLIEHFGSVSAPVYGWNTPPPSNDQSIAANCIRARILRNFLAHFPRVDKLSTPELNTKWIEGTSILNALSYTGNISVNDLKSTSLDQKNQMLLRSLVWYLEVEQEKTSEKVMDNSAELESLSSEVEDLKKQLTTLINSSNENETTVKDELVALIEETFNSLEEIKVSEIEKQQKANTKSIQQLQNAAGPRLNNDDLALPPVWQIIWDMIGDDWNELLKTIGTNLNAGSDSYSAEENKQQHFEELQKKISWWDLRTHLLEINRHDIMKKIINTTCLTKGLNRMSYDLKERYKKDLHSWNKPKPLNRESTEKSRKTAYVDLAMVDRAALDEESSNSDHEYIWRHNTPTSTVEPADLMQPNDRLIVVRGVAGVGKTSFINSFVLKWASNELLQDVDFLFKFTCRELNRLVNVESLNELLRKFNTTVEQLSEVSEKVAFVIDGFDEFQYSEDIVNESNGLQGNSKISSVLFDLISPNSINLHGKRILISGRPQSCDMICRAFSSDNIKPKLIEISGFSKENINLFIHQELHNDPETAQFVESLVVESESLNAMARIPVYLSILCDIYGECAADGKADILTKDRKGNIQLNTFTKLSIVSCLVYLRNHMRNSDGSSKDNKTLNDMCEDMEVIKVIKQLAYFSYKSLKTRTLVFAKRDFLNNEWNLIERSGIIEKSEGNEESTGELYQFKHLTYQEFLSSLYIFMHGRKLKLIQGFRHLTNCLPIVAGLEGLLLPSCDAPKYIKTFVRNITKNTDLNSLMNNSISVFSGSVINLFASRYLQERSMSALLNYEDELFFAMFYEYQGELSAEIKAKFEELTLDFELIRFHHTLRNVTHFLKMVPVAVDGISLRMQDGCITSKEVKALTPHLAASKKTNIYWTTLDPVCLSNLSTTIQSEVQKDVNSLDRCWVVVDNAEENKVESNERGMKVLVLENCDLNEISIEKMRDCIPFVEGLHLGYNKNLNPEAMRLIASSITEAVATETCYLKDLWLNDCDLDDLCIEKLSKCIPYLEYLRLNYNKRLTAISMELLAVNISGALKRNVCKLKELWLTDCDLDEQCIDKLKVCVPYLERLMISFNQNMSPSSMEFISHHIEQAVIANMSKIKELNLSYCNLNDMHIEHLKDCIPYIKTLSFMGNSKIGSTSMEIISNSVKKVVPCDSCYLEELYLDECNLDEDCIQKLSHCIPYIEHLKLNGNTKINSESIKLLAQAICESTKKNTYKFKKLNLSACDLDEESIEKLTDCIPLCESLTLAENQQMNTVSLDMIASSIINAAKRDCCRIQELNLSFCGLNDKKVEKLLPCLEYLRRLVLTSNRNMTSESVYKIVGILEFLLKYDGGKKDVTVAVDVELFDNELKKHMKKHKHVKYRSSGVNVSIHT